MRFESSVEFSNLLRSIIRTSASRIAAYWEIIAKIPVAAATPIVKYFAPSVASSNIPKAATTKTPMSIRVGAICA